MQLTDTQLKEINEALTDYRFLQPDYGEFESFKQYCSMQWGMTVRAVNLQLKAAGYMSSTEWTELDFKRPIIVTQTRTGKTKRFNSLYQASEQMQRNIYYLLRLCQGKTAHPLSGVTIQFLPYDEWVKELEDDR